MAGWKGKAEWLSAARNCAPALYSRVEGEFSAAAYQMVAVAQSLCPTQVDAPFHEPPGTLRASIDVKFTLDRGNAFHVEVVAGAGAAYYGRFVEFGTRAGVKGAGYVNRKGRKRKVYRTHPGTPPHPFFWPAYHQTIGQVHAALGDIAKSALAEAVG
jgi:HK97 gp10 family phage protein